MILLYNTWNSFDNGYVKFDWLLPDLLVCKIAFANDADGVIENRFKSWLEEFWLDFCNFIEFDKCILKNTFVIFLASQNNNIKHIWDQINKLLGISHLYGLKVVADCLEGGESDVEGFVVKCLSENIE